MMKKLFFFGMIGAMALSFNACTSDEDALVAPQTNETVKTQFSISLPGSYFNTRMTAAATQAAGTLDAYRGIDVLKIYAFGATATRTDGEFTIKSETMFSGTPITLSGIAKADLGGSVYDKWYEATVPLKTTAFLVYGKPTTTEGGALDAYYKTTKDGSLTTTGDKAGDLSFNLVSVAGADYTFATDGANLLTALNSLPSVTGKPNAASEAKAWSAITVDENAAYYELYRKFITLTAGSYTSVKAMLEDLKASVDVTKTDCTDNTGIDYKLSQAVATAITTLGTTDFTKAKGLPDGAAKLTFANGAFSFAGDYTGVIGQNSTWKISDYVKPAELYYRANSPIRVAPQLMSDGTTDKVEAAGSWANFIATYPNAKTVDPTTQSIALVDELQYAVGNLATYVKFASTTLEENVVITPAVPATSDNPNGTPAVYRTVTLPEAGLELTGILVGGQKNVDFEFMPVTTSGATEYTIYDPTIENKMITTAFGNNPAAYTLVLETAKETKKVRVALEFINSLTIKKGDTDVPVDFYGVNDQIIPYGTKFYLIGELDLDALTGDAKVIDQIFKQDYLTKMQLTVGSLKNAYNVVPDLRTPKLELGLAVNLEWQAGNIFQVTIE